MAKGPDAFRTISEAAVEVGAPQHVLRFWETKFGFVRPMKGAGGRRFYRRQDVELLAALRVLLHDRGCGAKAVQELHREQGLRGLMAAAAAPPSALTTVKPSTPAFLPTSRTPLLRPATAERLQAVLSELEAVKARLDGMLAASAAA